jgi:2-polyprenyl-3-methyl-5-hydroxy-6-metoxy-1,4-benzoquinol methylase
LIKRRRAIATALDFIEKTINVSWCVRFIETFRGFSILCYIVLVSNQDFTNTFLDCIKPGHHVLDLGAGQGNFTQMFVERGARVTAVDIRLPKLQDTSIISEKTSIEEFCASEQSGQYDRIFARNVLQFLDKPWVFKTLFPWMEEHITVQGIIGIETFYQDPEPPFEHVMRSLYPLKELTAHFMSWTELYVRDYCHSGLDMSGQIRKFFLSSLIVKRPDSSVRF